MHCSILLTLYQIKLGLENDNYKQPGSHKTPNFGNFDRIQSLTSFQKRPYPDGSSFTETNLEKKPRS